jgi:two-component system, LuxR family, sensor kinase FixL
MHNAQAAQQYLEHDKCDMHAVREILRDIVTDDERAAEVIERLRALLKKGEFQPEALAVDQLVQSVLKLLNHELKARSLSVVLNLSPGLRLIRGDRVQLQQVLINLILNASDAMQKTGPVRILTLGSNSTESEAIAISVSDTAMAFFRATRKRSSNYATKPQGLGLGLSLSRSIVLAHGGRTWAENRDSGATIHLTVPSWHGESRLEPLAQSGKQPFVGL